MNWSTQRKLVYGGAVVITLVLCFIYYFRGMIFPTPTCNDQKQNGYETGVDCGGICNLRCPFEVIPLSVSWTRAVRTSPSTFDFIGLISNKNIDNAPREISYTFTAYDGNGSEMVKLSGSTIAPIDGDFPIIRSSVPLPHAPTEVTLTLESDVPHYKVVEKPTVPTLRISDTQYEPGSKPRVYATITNQKRINLRDIPIRVLLYDANGNAYAGGETVIPELGKEESERIVVLWGSAFPEAPTKIRVFPIFDPFLGSQ